MNKQVAKALKLMDQVIDVLQIAIEEDHHEKERIQKVKMVLMDLHSGLSSDEHNPEIYDSCIEYNLNNWKLITLLGYHSFQKRSAK